MKTTEGSPSASGVPCRMPCWTRAGSAGAAQLLASAMKAARRRVLMAGAKQGRGRSSTPFSTGAYGSVSRSAPERGAVGELGPHRRRTCDELRVGMIAGVDQPPVGVLTIEAAAGGLVDPLEPVHADQVRRVGQRSPVALERVGA